MIAVFCCTMLRRCILKHFRRTGKRSPVSKERRLEPQIVVGLLVDQKGFPLSLQCLRGIQLKQNDGAVLQEFREDYGMDNLTVVADAAMLNQGNLHEDYRKTALIILSDPDSIRCHLQLKST